jgi:Cupin superfamily protein
MLRRPRFKPELCVQVAPGEGVLLRSEQNTALLRGRLYELVAPCLDGRPVEEVVAQLQGQISGAQLYYTISQLEQKGHLTESAEVADQTPGRFGLRDLLDGTGADAYDPNRILIGHGSAARFPELVSLEQFTSPEAFLAAWHGKASVRVREADKARSLQADAGDLLAHYHRGANLYFCDVQKAIPTVSVLAYRLADELRIKREQVTCEVFLGGAGTGIDLHFDPYAGFNIQLAGRKTWKVAYNLHVVFPRVHWTIGQEVPLELAEHARLPLPEECPIDALTFEAVPGTVVHLPHGAWHATVAHEPSLAVVFSPVTQTWATTVLQSLKAVLHRSEKWRERPIGIEPGEERRKLRELIVDLLQTVARLDAESLGHGTRCGAGRRATT